jgi:hypothetical protein
VLEREVYRHRLLILAPHLGGHFATLNAEDLLRAGAGIDAVRRFARESAIAAIAQGALDDERAQRTPGRVFLDSLGQVRAGAPPVWTSSSVLTRGWRVGALPEHLGFAAADLVSSRGCEAHCS